MKPNLVLHQQTVAEASPTELIEIAHASGCGGVAVFTHLPPFLIDGVPIPKLEFEIVGPGHKQALLARSRDLGVTIETVDFIGIHPQLDASEYRASLELSGELGAKGVTLWIQDGDDARVIDNLGRLCEVAAENGMMAAIEFVGFAPYCDSIARAAHFVSQVGLPNLKIAVDMLCLVRTGGTVADVEQLPADYLGFAQLCDGYGTHRSGSYFKEAMDRLMPGEGDWPVIDVLRALPPELPLELEIPSRVARRAGMSPLDRAKWAVSATQALLTKLSDE